MVRDLAAIQIVPSVVSARPTLMGALTLGIFPELAQSTGFGNRREQEFERLVRTSAA